MKKLTPNEFIEIKDFLKLSTIGEVMRGQNLDRMTVYWVNEAKDHEEYKKAYNSQLQVKFRSETLSANSNGFRAKYNTTDKLDEIYKMIKDIKESIERLELLK